MHLLVPDCLDRFHDDVQAVVDHLLTRATPAIENLEGWVVRRIRPATIDAHRRRRGARGAQQRARVPAWLATALGHDPWLVLLAERILEWVGIDDTGVWPADSWAQVHAVRIGGPRRLGPADVSRDVEHVLTTMRSVRHYWYEQYVEGPHDATRLRQVMLAGPVEMRTRSSEDEDLGAIAAVAIDAIAAGLARGGDPAATVRSVIDTLFLGVHAAARSIGKVPGSGDERDDHVAAAVEDLAVVARVVETVLAVVRAGD